jgi:hypothetical protein
LGGSGGGVVAAADALGFGGGASSFFFSSSHPKSEQVSARLSANVHGRADNDMFCSSIARAKSRR